MNFFIYLLFIKKLCLFCTICTTFRGNKNPEKQKTRSDCHTKADRCSSGHFRYLMLISLFLDASGRNSGKLLKGSDKVGAIVKA